MNNPSKELKKIEKEAKRAGLLSPAFAERVTMDREDHGIIVDAPDDQPDTDGRLPEIPKYHDDIFQRDWIHMNTVKERSEFLFDKRILVTSSGRMYRTKEIPSGYALKQIRTYQDGGSGHMRAIAKIDGSRKNLKPYKLVAELFIPNPGGFKSILFRDGDKRHVSYKNLYWGKREHTRKKYTRVAQELSEETLQEIMELFREGVSRKEIAEGLELKYNTVCAVIQRRGGGDR